MLNRRSALSTLVITLLALFALRAEGRAQLNASCTVSAFNRTAPVQADGVWVLSNVPTSLGQVRVRATCVENGVLRFGQSALVTIPADGTVTVDQIDFTAPVAIPSSLRLSAPSVLLGAVGQTVQLTALATYPDGSTADMTPADKGTKYRTSNPAIASVDAAGLVTARASGLAILSATTEGVLGVLRIEVVTSGDSDGDGLPDDWELSHGLDPNNPVDALADPDGDGLSTIDEYRSGTDPFNSDTDGDRLLDGDEINLHGTNPSLFDTDGDQVSDGLEVLAGSNPLAADSVDLGPILESLTVRPASFTLVFNTVVGEASRRLDVSARLIDGTTIEARSRRYGTTYQSSDLTVANFGAEDGLVFAGENGTATVTVRIGTFTGSSAVRVETFAPTALAYLHLPGFPNGVAVSGDYAYVASGEAGLQVVDVSDLAAPVLVGSVDTPGNANDVRVQGTFAYVADGVSGLQVVDVGDPAHPRIVGARDTPGNATDLVVQDDRVYIADGLAGMQVIDVANRALPVLLGGVNTPGFARGIDVVDSLVVVADGSGGVHVVSVANPAQPSILGSTHTRVTWSRAADVAVRGRLAWVADGADRTLGGLRVVDFSDPETPVVVGRTSDAYGLVSVALDGGRVLAADYYFVNGVPVFDSGANPALAAVLDFSRFRDDNGNGVAVRADGAAFLAATASIQDNGTSDWGGLYIGRYRFEGDELGVAPEVTVTAPAAGAAARERTSVILRAQATDDVRVESVAFLVDGVEVFRDFKRPYETTIRVPIGAASLRIGATALDMAGNEGTAEEVVLTVLPDDKPVVTLLSPAAGASLREGSRAEVVALATDDVRVSTLRVLIDGVLRATFSGPPYRIPFLVSPGASQVTVQVEATDNVGQTTSVTAVVPVEDDLPPFVAVVAPAAGAQVIEGSLLVVTVGAADDQGVSSVELSSNGSLIGIGSSAPYEFSLGVPTGVSELRLTAVAEDALGQRSTSAETVVSVVPDPLTTAVGRVLDDQGVPVFGAIVNCRDYFGSTDASGSFSIAGLPFIAWVVSCAAEFTSPAGTSWRVVSAPRRPVAGGITDVGDLRPTSLLLYASFESGGAAALLNADTLAGALLEDTGTSGGLSGLALGSSGRLFASTLEGPPGGRTSRLLELDPSSGAVLAVIGPVTDGAGGSPLGVGDLAIQPATDTLFALRTWEDGSGQAGRLYVVDPANGVASLVGGTGTDGADGLAFAPDGALYATKWDSNRSAAFLLSLDPADASTLSEVRIASPSGTFRGLAARPSDGLLLGALQRFTESSIKPQEVVAIDPATGLVSEIGFIHLGVLEDLELRPLPPPEEQTTVVGRLLDAFGSPVPGLRVTVRSLFESVSGSDGRFAIPGVPASFGAIVVTVPPSDFASGGAESGPQPAVAGGTTDVGDIVVAADDPKTRAVGRVLDEDGAPVAGAGVDCQGYAGQTDAGGAFDIAGVSILDQMVVCSATFTTPDGGVWSARSGPRAPVPGGVTEVGDLRPTSHLLYAGFLPDSFGTPSDLAVLNADTLQGSFFEGSGAAALSGLASDSLGRLFATTLEGPPGSRTSRLLKLDPGTGAVLAEIGPVTDGPGGDALSVGDLAVQPDTDALFALRTGEDGHGRAGELHELNRVTGTASRVGDTGTDGAGGLAFTPDGTLYATRWDEPAIASFLRTLDPADGSTLAEVAIPNPYGAFTGLAARPGDGLLLATLKDSIGFVVAIDPASGLNATFGFPLLGVIGDLSFHPLPPPGERTTVVGRVVDGTGLPIEEARVTVRDVFRAASGADGRFVLSRVPASFGDLVVTASVGRACDECTAQHSASSAPTPAVAGGTTDVGNLVLADINPPTTVVGTVVDELGQPVPGAAVKVFNGFVIATTTTDAAGAYTVANVSGEETLRILATALVGGLSLRGQDSVQPVPNGVAEAIPITLSPREVLPDPQTVVTGRVLDSEGSPVAGARVHVFDDWDVFPATTGPDGSFSLPGVPTVDGDLYARATVRRQGQLHEGTSGFFPSEPGGTTDLGVIEIQLRDEPPPQSRLAGPEDRSLLASLTPLAAGPAGPGPRWCPAEPAPVHPDPAFLLAGSWGM